MNTYTNKQVAEMNRSAIFETFNLSSQSNAWNLQNKARQACDAGKSDEAFIAKRNVAKKTAPNDAPIIQLCDKAKLVAQLMCLNAGKEFNTSNVKFLIEDCEPKEIGLLDNSQFDELKLWAGVETQEQRIENYENALFAVTHSLAQAIDKREELIERYNISLDSDNVLVAVFKKLAVIVLTDDEIAAISILDD